MNLVFFYIAVVLYVLGILHYLFFLVTKRQGIASVATLATAVGFFSHTAAIILRGLEAGRAPFTNLFETLSFFSWAIILVHLLAVWRYRLPILGTFMVPLSFIFISLSLSLPKTIVDLMPALKSYWIWFHVSLCVLGYAAFALIFVVGVLYLLQERQLKSKHLGSLYFRLPSLEVLDEIGYRFLTYGFPLMTLGIITGAIWAEYAWGSYWNWDPKETWSLITWLIYAALLHSRLVAGWRGKKAAIISIIGFCVVIFTFLGVNLLLTGLHAYN